MIEIIQSENLLERCHQISEKLINGYIVAKRSGKEVLRIDPALTAELDTIDSFLETSKDICENLNTPKKH